MRKRLTFRKVNLMRFNHLLSESVDVNNGDIPEPIKTGQHSGVVICFASQIASVLMSPNRLLEEERKKRLRRERFFALLLIHDKGFNITMVDIPTIIVITETFENPTT